MLVRQYVNEIYFNGEKLEFTLVYAKEHPHSSMKDGVPKPRLIGGL
jgi:hypothetical protein